MTFADLTHAPRRRHRIALSRSDIAAILVGALILVAGTILSFSAPQPANPSALDWHGNSATLSTTR